MGKSTMDRFQISLDIMQPRLIPLRKKLYEIEVLLGSDIHLFANEPESQRLDRLKIIENILAEELTFLFYLNLNMITFSGKSGYSNEPRPGTF